MLAAEYDLVIPAPPWQVLAAAVAFVVVVSTVLLVAMTRKSRK